VPVIAGNRTSLPEVVGEAGLLFDPFDTQALVKALTQVLNDSEYRASLRAKGFEKAREFNWQTTARLTLGVYERVVKRKRANGRDD
jgi:glycosyltransferase involved in cell wall biosynthesis